MKFECGRDDITNAVNSAQKAVSPKSNVPQLEGIEIAAGLNKIVIFGTDNEIGVECTFPALVEQTGKAVVNAKLFSEIVRNLQGDTVSVETLDDAKIRISSAGAVFVIFMIQTDTFPGFPDVEQTRMYEIDRLTLKKMFSQTSFAISADESRKVLTGLLLESANGELRAVAVDGYRIALRKQPVDPEVAWFKMIIPARTVGELIKIIPSEMGGLRLYGGDNQAVIEFGGTRVYTRIIEGEFFNYRYILPNEYMTQIVVNRQKLQEAIERAALIISSELIKRYPVRIKVVDGYISVYARSDVGNAEDEIDVEMEGESIELAFNPRFLIETLRAIEDDTIVMRFTTKVGQCVIKPINNDNYTYLILPVKVSE